jgi:hypothetical protein
MPVGDSGWCFLEKWVRLKFDQALRFFYPFRVGTRIAQVPNHLSLMGVEAANDAFALPKSSRYDTCNCI